MFAQAVHPTELCDRPVAVAAAMSGGYTASARLCDDAGLVSDALVTPPNPFDPELTYLRQLNNLRARTRLGAYTGPAFVCTGAAHLAGEHIRCTNPIHLVALSVTHG